VTHSIVLCYWLFFFFSFNYVRLVYLIRVRTLWFFLLSHTDFDYECLSQYSVDYLQNFSAYLSIIPVFDRSWYPIHLLVLYIVCFNSLSLPTFFCKTCFDAYYIYMFFGIFSSLVMSSGQEWDINNLQHHVVPAWLK
jgi:hypothetical protein